MSNPSNHFECHWQASRLLVILYALAQLLAMLALLLAGAAFFEVTRDAQRPFVVDVPGAQGGVRITLLGTRFGVERLPGDAVEVQVESGRVRVEALDAQGQVRSAHALADGEVLRVEGATVRQRDGAPAAPWRDGLVVFADVPLADAIERLRRYLPRPVELDAEAARLRLSGQVRIAQAEDFVRALPSAVSVSPWLDAGRWRISAR